MAQLREIKVNYGRTKNLGNYESERVDVELAATLLPGEDSQQAVEDLYHMAKKKVNEYIIARTQLEDIY